VGGALTAVAHLLEPEGRADLPGVHEAATRLAVDGEGTAWLAIAGLGLAAVTDTAVVLHGPAQGVCGLDVGAVAAGAGPWVAARCDTHRLAIGRRGVAGEAAWQSLTVRGGTLEQVGSGPRGPLVRVAGQWYLAEPGQADPQTVAAGAPVLVSADPPPSSPTPAVTPPTLPEGVAARWKPRRVAAGAPLAAAPWRLIPLPLQPQAGGRVQVDAEGTLWRLGTEGGLAAVAGPARQTYATEALGAWWWTQRAPCIGR
jgi:hypothetical protein